MALTEIKESKFATTCATCGRELKAGWHIFWDKDNKKNYCTVCAKDVETPKGNDEALLKIKAGITSICPRCGNAIYPESESYYDPETMEVYCLNCGDTILKSGDSGDILIAISSIKNLDVEIAGSVNLLIEQMPIVIESMNKVLSRLDVLETKLVIASVKETKEKETKEKVEKS